MNLLKRQRRAKQARKNQNKWRASRKFKSSINRVMHMFIGLSKKEAKAYVRKNGLPQ